VKQAWYQLYHLEERIRVTRENIDLLNSFKSIAEIKFESGRTSLVDVLRVEMELEELQNRLKKLEDKRPTFQKEFARLLNKDMNSKIALPDTMDLHQLEAKKTALLDSIRQNNPQLARLSKARQAQEKGIEVARKEGYPDLGLRVDYVITQERNVEGLPDNGQNAFMPKLSVKIPLYRKKYRAQRKEARYRMEAVRQQEKNRLTSLLTDFEEAYQQYRDARRRVQLYQEQVGRARQAIDIQTANYSSAGEDFEEILRMQRKLLDYRLSLEKALVDQNLGVAKIKYLTGDDM